jgi:hypothetical protein
MEPDDRVAEPAAQAAAAEAQPAADITGPGERR